MRRRNVKNEIFVATRCVFSSSKYTETRFLAKALPRTPLGELTMLPGPSSRLGREHPSPYPPPSTSLTSRSRRLACQAPEHKFLAYPFFPAYNWLTHHSKNPGAAPGWRFWSLRVMVACDTHCLWTNEYGWIGGWSTRRWTSDQMNKWTNQWVSEEVHVSE